MAPSKPSEPPNPSAKAMLNKEKRVILNPMAPMTFLLRNAGKTIPLALVIVMAVMLIAGIIALIDSIPLSIKTIYSYSKVSLGLSPRGDPSETPKLLSIIKKEAPVPIDRVLVCRASGSQVRSIVGEWPFLVLGLSQPDITYFLDRQAVTHLEGHYPSPGKPEILVSKPVATNLHLHIGSPLLGPDKEYSYSPLVVKVVGIADTNKWLMVDSIEYQRLYYYPPADFAMVFAKNPVDEEKLDTWATKRFLGSNAQVFTYDDIEKQTEDMFKTLFLLLDLVIGMLTLVITLMMGLLINIYQSQRLVEFGLLQAVGYTKKKLVLRSLFENVLIVALGWVLGLLASYILLVILDALLMAPQAYALNVIDTKALEYTIPVPITVLFTACFTVFWRFRNFDPVAVVERRLV